MKLQSSLTSLIPTNTALPTEVLDSFRLAFPAMFITYTGITARCCVSVLFLRNVVICLSAITALYIMRQNSDFSHKS